MGSREKRAERLRILEEQRLAALGLTPEEEVVEKPKKAKKRKSIFKRKKS